MRLRPEDEGASEEKAVALKHHGRILHSKIREIHQKEIYVRAFAQKPASTDNLAAARAPKAISVRSACT
jgi:hypothetical protein